MKCLQLCDSTYFPCLAYTRIAVQDSAGQRRTAQDSAGQRRTQRCAFAHIPRHHQGDRIGVVGCSGLRQLMAATC
jgi:hypothetical protein